MRRFALAALLWLSASSASAATYYISPTGTATWANATNPATPASIYTANTQAVAGDLIIAQGGGTYPFRIKPRRSGTSGNPIVYAGAAGSPTAADFPGITLGDSNNSESGPLARGNYVTVKWVRISGSITIDSQALSGGGTNIPTGDSLHAIDHTGGSTTTLKGRLVSYTSSTSTTRQINMFGDGGFFLGPNTISDLQVDGTNTSGGDYQFFRLSKVHGLSITDSRFYVSNAAPSTGYSFFLETYGCRNVDFLRNHVVYRDSSNAGGGSKIYWGHRDSSQFIRIVGNDMDFGGPTPAHFRLSHSGTPVGDCCNRGIRFEHNNVRLRNVASSFAGVLADIGTHADTVRFNLIETWGGTAGFRTQNTVDSLLFAHNTIIHNGQQAVRLQATSTTGTRAVANLAYARTANGTGSTSSVFYAHESMALDSVGTIFSPGGNSAGGIYRSTSGAGTPGAGGVFGISGKAVWGSPRLMNGASFDSTQGTPAGVSQTGYALSVKAPNLQDGFSGAFSDSTGGSSSSADVTPPDQVSDLLDESWGQSTVELSWTAPGDDGSTGTATTYDFRWSLSNITSGNFLSATPFSSQPTPTPAPNAELWTTPQDLSPGTTYYVAMRTADEAGNWSGISNVVTGTTASVPDTFVALSIVTKDVVAGLTFDYAFDADTNATMTVLYGITAATDTAHAPARRPGSARTWVTSLFGLAPSTTYNIALISSDGARQDTTFTTRADRWWYRTQTGPSIYVSPGGNDATGTGLTQGSPKRTISSALTTLLAQTNQGRGGAIVLMDGIHYQRATISGTSGTPSAGYIIKALNQGAAIIDGADERLINGHTTLTWTAHALPSDSGAVGGAWNTGDTLYFASYASADSLDGFWVNGYAYHRATTYAEIRNKTGASGGGGYNLQTQALGHYLIEGGRIYVRAKAGTNIRTASIRAGYRPSLLYIDDPYWQVEGITFQHAGGMNSGNGIGVRFMATDNSRNGTVYRCSFVNNDREGVYAIDHVSRPGWADSMTVAECVYSGGRTDLFGYAASKGRREEARDMTAMDGYYNTIIDNSVTESFNGISHYGITDRWQSASELDVARNSISYTSDDAIEVEVGHAINARVIGNYATRFGNGISLAPVYTGPTFYIGNLLRYARSGGGAFKVGDASTGQAFAYHNTFIADTTVNNSAFYTPGGYFSRKVFVNNVLTGSSATWPGVRNSNTGGGSPSDTTAAITNLFNYNLTWSTGGVAVVWKGTSLNSTQWGQRGQEHNGVLDLAPGWQDSSAGKWNAGRGIDAGRRIAGITGVLTGVVGAGPDIGAVEYEPGYSPAETGGRHRGKGALRRRVRVRLP